jgi:hypothetical protein
MVQPNLILKKDTLLILEPRLSQQCHVLVVFAMVNVSPQNQNQHLHHVIRTNVILNAHRPEGVWDKKLHCTLIDVDSMQCLIRWSRFCTSNISFLEVSICGFIILIAFMCTSSALRIKPTAFLFFYFFAITIELQERLQFDVMHVSKIKELIDSWVSRSVALFN